MWKIKSALNLNEFSTKQNVLQEGTLTFLDKDFNIALLFASNKFLKFGFSEILTEKHQDKIILFKQANAFQNYLNYFCKFSIYLENVVYVSKYNIQESMKINKIDLRLAGFMFLIKFFDFKAFSYCWHFLTPMQSGLQQYTLAHWSSECLHNRKLVLHCLMEDEPYWSYSN